MSNLIRFKDFEVNARSGELLRRGSKVRLQNQPFQVLMLLLENAGEVVTREELQARVWEHDTFVDFDRGLNKAIHLLRRALRDRVIKPHFIENLPRRGYRFMVPVETVEISAARLPKSQTSSPRIRLESVAVLPLENLSGDPAHEYFSDGTTAELISGLARIGSARVISRMSAMALKGTRKTVRAIARQLRPGPDRGEYHRKTRALAGRNGRRYRLTLRGALSRVSPTRAISVDSPRRPASRYSRRNQ